jgi:hypothetical protein
MGHYYKDVINSLSRSLDTILDDQVRLQGEQKIYEEHDLKTIDIDGGGPWFEQCMEKKGVFGHAK